MKVRAETSFLGSLFFGVVLFGLSVLPSIGQETESVSNPSSFHPGRFTFRAYDRDQGFPSSAIHHLAQDEDGFIWLGTENGLYRYDGNTTTRWGSAEGLPSDWVLRILPHPRGGFWVGTSLGLARFHEGLITPVTLQGRPWEAHVISMDLDDQGRLVVAGINAVMIQNSDTDLVPLPGCPAVTVNQVEVSRSGNILFASDSGLYERLPDGRWILYGAEEGLAFHPGQIQEDGLENLWVVNGRNLAVKISGTDRFEDRSEWMPGSFYSGSPLFADPEGYVWLPTQEGALRVRGDSRRHYGPQEGMPSRLIRVLFKDREKSLWVSTSSLLYRLLGQGNITAYTQQEGLPSNMVWSVFQDRDGGLWTGTGDGLARMEAEGWRTIRGSEGMTILSIDQDAQGKLWLTNLDGPPAILDERGRLTILRDMGDSSRAMRVSLERSGKAWFSILGGRNVMRYDPLSRRLTPIAEIYPEVLGISPRALYEGPKEEIWIAGASGLGYRESAEWQFLGSDDGLRSAKIRGLALMNDGTAWAWYVEPYGMSRLGVQNGRLEVLSHLDAKTGLASDLVYAAGLGKDGALWVTTDRGVNRWQNGEMRRFGFEEGFLTEDCNLGALELDRNGDVWVGTSSGIMRIRAGRLPELKPLPPPVILRYDDGQGTHLAPFGPLAPIPHSLASMEFRFSVPTYLEERNLQYEVRLLGLEDRWHPTDIRQARYPVLRGGRYRFEVRVARAGSAFGPASALEFEVLPAWWQSWWFHGLLFMGAAGLVALFVRWRLRTLQAAKRELAALVAERTLELEKTNQALAETNRALKEQSLTDPLTGLRNRRYLSLGIQEDLARALRMKRQRRNNDPWDNGDLVFFIVDLDRFKLVNDNYGHHAGDAVLIQIAEILRRSMRESDTIVRWGGEEFLLLARDTSRVEALGVAERIRTAVEEHPFVISEDLKIRCTCSIGFAAYPFHESFPSWISWEKVVDMADHGLYLVKENGRNGWAGLKDGPALTADQDPSALLGDLPAALREHRLILQSSRPISAADAERS